LFEKETANLIFYNQNTSKILGMNYIFTLHIMADLVIILHRYAQLRLMLIAAP